jgi:hypothetical protein
MITMPQIVYITEHDWSSIATPVRLLTFPYPLSKHVVEIPTQKASPLTKPVCDQNSHESSSNSRSAKRASLSSYRTEPSVMQDLHAGTREGIHFPVN